MSPEEMVEEALVMAEEAQETNSEVARIAEERRQPLCVTIISVLSLVFNPGFI